MLVLSENEKMKAGIQSQILQVEELLQKGVLTEEQKMHLRRRLNFLNMVMDSKVSEIGQGTSNFVYGV